MTKLLIVGGTYCFGESEFGVLISESELYYIIYRLVKVDLRDKDTSDKLWTCQCIKNIQFHMLC